MKRTNFENLDVYKFAEQLADTVWEIVSTWKPLAVGTVGKQLIRSADSIRANIAEGTGRATVADKRHFARIARGSLYETKHWLRRAFKRKLLHPKQIKELQMSVEELTRTLNGYIRYLRDST